MSWQLKEKLKQRLASERGAIVYPPGARTGFALVYPNTYHVGMSNLGFHIIYEQLNKRMDTACERAFLPDGEDWQTYIRSRTPLMTLETQRALYQFPLVGIAMTFEMDYFHLPAVLELGRIPLRAADREERDPYIILGGPCATFNPEPLADFVDVCVIGEGEEVMQELLDTYYAAQAAGKDREQTLLDLAAIPGLYVPRFYQPVYAQDGGLKCLELLGPVPERIQKRWVRDLDAFPAHTVVVTDQTEFSNLYLLEVARGCGRHCRFCMAGYCFRRPRNRSLEVLHQEVQHAKELGCRAGLMGAAISDYPQIEALTAHIQSQGIGMSVASLRADTVTADLVQALAESGQKTMTIAPEAASERMRQMINKGITEEHVFRAIDLAAAAGIPNIRLYFMVGLPLEEQEDVEAFLPLAERVRCHMDQAGARGRLTLSVNPFIPKPFTPFQRQPMTSQKLVKQRLQWIQKALRKLHNTVVLVENIREAYVQGVLARGDRRLGSVLLAAHAKGGSRGWKQALAELEISEDFYLYRDWQAACLPWEHLDMGLHPSYLEKEWQRAQELKYTAPCEEKCRRCGICIE